MKLYDCSFCREAVKFINLGASFGWHERNAGNISLRLNRAEIDEISSEFAVDMSFINLPVTIKDMAGEFIFTTATGSYFTDIYESSFCICEISPDGGAYRVVLGEGRPTSELCGHLLSLSVLKTSGDGRRAVYHCHPADLVALTYLLPLDDKSFTTALWRCETECAFVFPRGIGVVGCQVPGSLELAKLTAEKLRKRDAVVWAFHGLFAAGDSIKSAFGLAHAVAKAAEIRLKLISSGREELCTISDEELHKIADAFGCELQGFDVT